MFKFKNRKNDIIRDSGQKLFTGKGLFSYLLLMDYKISFYEIVKMKQKVHKRRKENYWTKGLLILYY